MGPRNLALAASIRGKLLGARRAASRRGAPPRLPPGPLAIAVLFLAAAASRASDLDQFGFGGRAIAMGGAYTALATDWTAPYYNPAGIALGQTLQLGAGFGYADYNLHFKSEAGGHSFDHDVEHVSPLSALSFGFTTQVGAPDTFFNRIGVGIGVLMPTRHILTVDWESGPADPQYFLYGTRTDRLQLLPALAFRVPLGPYEATQQLAIGIGGNGLVNIDGEQTFALASTANQNDSVTTKINADYAIAPNAGIFYWPVEWLSFGLTYRGELSLGSKVDVVIDLTGSGSSDIPLDLRAVSFFQPQQLQGGFAIDPTDDLTISFDLTWKDWSSFKDPFLTIGTIVGQTDPHFHDTWTPRLGIEWDVYDGLALRVGYYYAPSPIPAQHGATNMIDLDKHVASLGAGWTWQTTRPKPGGKEGETEDIRPFSVDAFLEWQHLVPVKVQKDDPADSGGVGKFYEASGEIVYFGFTMTFRF